MLTHDIQLLLTKHANGSSSALVIETVEIDKRKNLKKTIIPHRVALIIPSLDLCDYENSEEWKVEEAKEAFHNK